MNVQEQVPGTPNTAKFIKETLCRGPHRRLVHRTGQAINMKRAIKFVLWGIVTLFLVGATIVPFAKDRLVRNMTVRMLSAATGFGVELDSVRLGILARTVDFEGLRLRNPESFDIPEAITISRVHAAWTWSALLRRTASFRRIHVHIPSVTIVRPKSGPSNMELLQQNIVQLRDGSGAEQEPASASIFPLPREMTADAPSSGIRIGELRVHLGTIYIIDYKIGGDTVAESEYEFDHEEVFTNVTDLDEAGTQLATRFGINLFINGITGQVEISPGAKKEILSATNEMVQEMMQDHRQIEVENAEKQFEELLRR